jgi:hypothetical protein
MRVPAQPVAEVRRSPANLPMIPSNETTAVIYYLESWATPAVSAAR